MISFLVVNKRVTSFSIFVVSCTFFASKSSKRIIFSLFFFDFRHPIITKKRKKLHPNWYLLFSTTPFILEHRLCYIHLNSFSSQSRCFFIYLGVHWLFSEMSQANSKHTNTSQYLTYRKCLINFAIYQGRRKPIYWSTFLLRAYISYFLEAPKVKIESKVPRRWTWKVFEVIELIFHLTVTNHVKQLPGAALKLSDSQNLLSTLG